MCQKNHKEINHGPASLELQQFWKAPSSSVHSTISSGKRTLPTLPIEPTASWVCDSRRVLPHSTSNRQSNFWLQTLLGTPAELKTDERVGPMAETCVRVSVSDCGSLRRNNTFRMEVQLLFLLGLLSPGNCTMSPCSSPARGTNDKGRSRSYEPVLKDAEANTPVAFLQFRYILDDLVVLCEQAVAVWMQNIAAAGEAALRQDVTIEVARVAWASWPSSAARFLRPGHKSTQLSVQWSSWISWGWCLHDPGCSTVRERQENGDRLPQADLPSRATHLSKKTN